MKSEVRPAQKELRMRLRELAADLQRLETKVRQGGGPEKIERQHQQGKKTARERIELLFDKERFRQEIGLLVAYDEYKEQAPSAGVVTMIGRVGGRETVVVANDATVKAGSWWPETIKKILRAQEISMRSHVPIIYLVDSAGVNLPDQGGVFPGQYGAARIFYYNSIMRRYLHIRQIAAVMGQCIAGGAYLPGLSDVILMVKGTSFMGLGGPNLVKGATGQVVDAETLGGASTHTEISGVAHYAVDDDEACIGKIRDLIDRLPRSTRDVALMPRGPERTERAARPGAAAGSKSKAKAPKSDTSAADLYDLLPADHRMSYDMHTVMRVILDNGEIDEFQE